MNKTTIITLISALFALASYAAAPEVLWLNGQSGIEIEIPMSTKASKDGNIYFLNNFSSSARPTLYDPQGNIIERHSITTDVYAFDLEAGTQSAIKQITGYPDKESKGGIRNASLLKMTPDGELLWTLNTQGGYCSSGEIAPTYDGGALLHFKMRHAAKAIPEPTVLCRIIDSKGTETIVEWQAPDQPTYGTIYQPVLVKVSADGIVEWAKRYNVSYKRELTEDRYGDYTDCFNIYDMVAGEDNSVYITGNYSTSINFGRKANFNEPHNPLNYEEKFPKHGDLFVVKLDLDTKYAIWGTTSQSEGIKDEVAKAIVIQDDKLYITGYMTGDGSTTVNLGDDELVPSEKNSLFFAQLSTSDGTFGWAKCYPVLAHPVTDNGARTKAMNVSVHGDDLYLSGSFYGNMYNGETLVLENDNLQTGGLRAYIIKADANDGSFKSAIKIDGPLTEVQEVIPYNGKILASGYALYASAYIHELDETLSPESLKSYPIKKSGLSVSNSAIIIGDRLFTAMNTDSGFFINGLEWTPSGGNYSLVGRRNCLFLAHDLKPLLTDIDEPAATDVARPYLYDQTLHFPADMLGAEAAIYNTQGLLIERFTVTDALTHRLYDIPQGMIITLVVNGKGYMLNN